MPNQEKNVSAVLHGAGDMQMESRVLAAPGPDEVTIRIKATGLCGSDLHYHVHGKNGDFALAHPMCLGHESSGEVVEVGSNVAKLSTPIKLGSRVVVEPGLNCSTCSYCLGGRYNLCPALRFASSAKTKPHLDGTLQKFFTWPARLCHLLPDHVNYRVAALIEPLAVVLQALSRSQLAPGQSVLILGAGAVGLLACAAAKAFGASFVAAVDIDSDRLEFGKKNGWIDSTYCLKGGKPATNATYASRKEEDGATIDKDRSQAKLICQHFSSSSPIIESEGGFDVVYECTGVPSCINLSIFAAKTGGKVSLIGMGNPIVTLALGAAALREVDIIGVFRYANMFPKAIKLLSSDAIRASGAGVRADQVASNGIDQADQGVEGEGTGSVGGVENLISHVYPLQRAVEAFDTMRLGRSPDGRGVVKVFVVDAEG